MRTQRPHLRAQLDTEIEVELSVTLHASFNGFDPGIVSGPVEACYPPEGGDLDDFRAELVIGRRHVAITDFGDFEALVGELLAAALVRLLLDAAEPDEGGE